MRNIKLVIEYDGSFYCGFQKQKKDGILTVQDEIEYILNRVLKQEIETIGSGRTDSGVHALNQVVSFKYDGDVTTNEIQRALNAMLHGKIIIKSCEDVPLDFHARFSAKKRTYRYYILNRKLYPSIGYNYVFNLRDKLDIDIMKQGAKLFIGEKDFLAFSSSTDKDKPTIRKVFDSNVYTGIEFIEKYGNIDIPIRNSWIEDLVIYEVTANGFLRSMVRLMTGTLIRIGRKKGSLNEITEALRTKNQALVHNPAPAHALFLTNVEY